MTIVLWIIQGGLFLSCAFSGFCKAFLTLTTVKRLFPWANHVPTTLTRFIGACELLGGIGLVLPAATGIVPWLTVIAAAGLALLMLCAGIFHAGRKEFSAIGVNVVLLALLVLIVIGRWAWV